MRAAAAKNLPRNQPVKEIAKRSRSTAADYKHAEDDEEEIGPLPASVERVAASLRPPPIYFKKARPAAWMLELAKYKAATQG